MATTVNEYQVGQVPRLSVDIEVASANTDPTALTFQIKVGPSGAVTTYTYETDVQLVKDSTGAYHVDWPITEEGEHYYQWAGTGTAAGAIEHRFRVADSQFYE